MTESAARELAEEILPVQGDFDRKIVELCQDRLEQALLSSRLVEMPSIMEIQRGLGVGFSQANKIVNFLKGVE